MCGADLLTWCCRRTFTGNDRTLLGVYTRRDHCIHRSWSGSYYYLLSVQIWFYFSICLDLWYHWYLLHQPVCGEYRMFLQQHRHYHFELTFSILWHREALHSTFLQMGWPSQQVQHLNIIPRSLSLPLPQLLVLSLEEHEYPFMVPTSSTAQLWKS